MRYEQKLAMLYVVNQIPDLARIVWIQGNVASPVQIHVSYPPRTFWSIEVESSFELLLGKAVPSLVSLALRPHMRLLRIFLR